MEWCRERCNHVGIKPYFPLWQCNRKNLIYELNLLGYLATVTIVNTTMLDTGYVGKWLTKSLVASIEQNGANACGENGEYHTFVSDGSLFRKPVQFNFGSVIIKNEYAILPIMTKEQNNKKE